MGEHHSRKLEPTSILGLSPASPDVPNCCLNLLSSDFVTNRLEMEIACIALSRSACMEP